MEKQLETAIEQLADAFSKRNWRYLNVPDETKYEKVYAWPGDTNENIMICVHKGCDIFELFHRQDFFFFNFAYRGDFNALSYQFDHQITIQEGECYIGQPMTGYALQSHSDEEFIIIGVLIQKGSFFRRFLPAMAADSKLFRFFLQPSIQEYADEFLHLRFEQDTAVRRLLELMVMEYVIPKEDTQKVLEPLVLSLLMYIAREYSNSYPTKANRLSDKIVQYMSEHSDVVTLKEVAAHFAYHPNYVSSLLHRELGRTFSELLLEQRMQKAAVMLKGTDLSVAEIAEILGYSNTSNFHIAFRDYYGKTPRAYAKTDYPD